MPKAPKAIHPNSRKAGALSKKSHRIQRLEKNAKDRNLKLYYQGEKLQWFHDQLDKEKKCLEQSEVCQLIERYLGRFEEEVEQIELANSIKGRKGLQHATRLQSITTTQETERQGYVTHGLELPDLTSKKGYRAFCEWSGELKTIQNLTMKKYKPSKQTEAEQEMEEEEDE